ncbi:MAG: NAD-dependent epimerase/dehydratase family protein [Gammaproteobacteria bacterium]
MNTPYVQHKLSMEKHVARHGGHLILRLPQLAGRSDNPHTLLNYLYLSIKQNKALSIWTKARRNIIDSMDMARIVRALVDDGWRNKTVNIANAHDYSLMEIVRIFETILGRPATVDFLERGSAYNIDVSAIEPYVKAEGIRFDKGYLERVLSKYYENN